MSSGSLPSNVWHAIRQFTETRRNLVRKLARATATAALTVAAVAIPLTGTAMASTVTAAPAQARLLHKAAFHNDGWCGDYRYNRYNRHHGRYSWSRWGGNCGYRTDWRGYHHVNYRDYDDWDDYRYCDRDF
jgi:hypothetical protein